MTAAQQYAVELRLPELAAELGRIRHRVEPGSSLGWAVDRCSRHVEALAWILLEPTAGQLVATTSPHGGEEVAAAAVEHVERRATYWQRLLGVREAV